MIKDDNHLSQRLIDSHYATRAHIRMLYQESQEVWDKIPRSEWGSSEWSMQSIAVEILNYEIKLLNQVINPKIDKISEDLTYEEFFQEEKRISSLLIKYLNEEEDKKGFVWTPAKDPNGPSLHWVLHRTTIHGIYHAGGISTLRSLLGLPRADYKKWPDMANSVFASDLVSDVLAHHGDN